MEVIDNIWAWIQSIPDLLIGFLFFVVHLVLVPIDLLLDKIPDIEVVPEAIANIVGFVGSVPATVVTLTGLNPFLWNAIFITFVLFIALAPAINAIKKIWAWVRP